MARIRVFPTCRRTATPGGRDGTRWVSGSRATAASRQGLAFVASGYRRTPDWIRVSASPAANCDPMSERRIPKGAREAKPNRFGQPQSQTCRTTAASRFSPFRHALTRRFARHGQSVVPNDSVRPAVSAPCDRGHGRSDHGVGLRQGRPDSLREPSSTPAISAATSAYSIAAPPSFRALKSDQFRTASTLRSRGVRVGTGA